MESFQQISIVGSGNVATHLAQAFYGAGISVKSIYSRDIQNAVWLASKVAAMPVDALAEIDKTSDLIIVSVKDDSLEEVLASLSDCKIPVVHTSGTHGLELFPSSVLQSGILYPLQTFSKYAEVDMTKVPLLVYSENENMRDCLVAFANTISQNVYVYDDVKRRHLHIAAVIANNFTNHLFAISQAYAKQHAIDYALLKPLIERTFSFALQASSGEHQTGPAQRKDIEIVQKHLDVLRKEAPSLVALYQLLSESIMDK